jgi:hypothetical protein
MARLRSTWDRGQLTAGATQLEIGIAIAARTPTSHTIGYHSDGYNAARRLDRRSRAIDAATTVTLEGCRQDVQARETLSRARGRTEWNGNDSSDQPDDNDAQASALPETQISPTSEVCSL